MNEVIIGYKDLERVIDEASNRTANKTLAKLKNAGKIKHYFSSSFKKTEEVLTLYPKISDENPNKARITAALDKIRQDEYFGVIESKYFDGMTIFDISEIYDCKQQTISKNRNRLVKILANELFPDDVLKEILER